MPTAASRSSRAEHRQWRDRQRQRTDLLRTVTCKRPLRHSVRDFPLHFDPHSRFPIPMSLLPREIRGFCVTVAARNFPSVIRPEETKSYSRQSRAIAARLLQLCGRGRPPPGAARFPTLTSCSAHVPPSARGEGIRGRVSLAMCPPQERASLVPPTRGGIRPRSSNRDERDKARSLFIPPLYGEGGAS